MQGPNFNTKTGTMRTFQELDLGTPVFLSKPLSSMISMLTFGVPVFYPQDGDYRADGAHVSPGHHVLPGLAAGYLGPFERQSTRGREHTERGFWIHEMLYRWNPGGERRACSWPESIHPNR